MSDNEQPIGEDDALLRSKDVAERYQVHVRTLPSLVESGRIPKPVEGWTGASKRWLKSEVVAHIRAMRKREIHEQAR